MAKPGTPSGENHSSDSQTCGLKRMPRSSSSWYRRLRRNSRGVPLICKGKSHRRKSSSCSSVKRCHLIPKLTPLYPFEKPPPPTLLYQYLPILDASPFLSGQNVCPFPSLPEFGNWIATSKYNAAGECSK